MWNLDITLISISHYELPVKVLNYSHGYDCVAIFYILKHWQFTPEGRSGTCWCSEADICDYIFSSYYRCLDVSV